MTLCEENCDLINYNYNNEKVTCSCEIKTTINPERDFKFNKKEFYKSFTDIKNIANIDILKCYKVVLKINELKYNYGFYIMTFIMLVYFITVFIFSFISFNKLKKDLYNISMNLIDINTMKDKESKESMIQKGENLIPQY